MAVLEKLENIDSETDNLDITFVKMADPRYAKKWGVTKLPAIVSFRRRFPSIYRGKRKHRRLPSCRLVIQCYFYCLFQVTFCPKRRYWNGCVKIVSASRNWTFLCMLWFHWRWPLFSTPLSCCNVLKWHRRQQLHNIQNSRDGMLNERN